jgi:hypothetical protein
MIKKLAIAASLAAATLILGTGTAFAVAPFPPPGHVNTSPGQNKLLCFDGTTDGGFGGVCTLNSNGAKGSATLDNSDTNPSGDYSGVYTANSVIYGQLLTDVSQLSYHYSGTIIPSAGNLSYNIPIDKDGNGTTDFYLFVDAAADGIHCPGVNGVVDIINDPVCVMYEGGVTPRANWATFLAANPGAKIATDNFVFVVAERTPSEPSAIWTVNNVKFGKGGK